MKLSMFFQGKNKAFSGNFRDVTSVPLLQVTVLGLPCPCGLVFVRGTEERGKQMWAQRAAPAPSAPSEPLSAALARAGLGYQLCAGLGTGLQE